MQGGRKLFRNYNIHEYVDVLFEVVEYPIDRHARLRTGVENTLSGAIL